jgi:hypothetical protein
MFALLTNNLLHIVFRHRFTSEVSLTVWLCDFQGCDWYSSRGKSESTVKNQSVEELNYLFLRLEEPSFIMSEVGGVPFHEDFPLLNRHQQSPFLFRGASFRRSVVWLKCFPKAGMFLNWFFFHALRLSVYCDIVTCRTSSLCTQTSVGTPFQNQVRVRVVQTLPFCISMVR